MITKEYKHLTVEFKGEFSPEIEVYNNTNNTSVVMDVSSINILLSDEYEVVYSLSSEILGIEDPELLDELTEAFNYIRTIWE